MMMTIVMMFAKLMETMTMIMILMHKMMMMMWRMRRNITIMMMMIFLASRLPLLVVASPADTTCGMDWIPPALFVTKHS